MSIHDIKRQIHEAILGTPALSGELSAGLDDAVDDVKKTGKMRTTRTIRVGERTFVIDINMFERKM